MSLSKFDNFLSLSNTEIDEKIKQTQSNIFNLKFKRATRQNFKLNKLKNEKRKLAQLKTLLTRKLEER